MVLAFPAMVVFLSFTWMSWLSWILLIVFLFSVLGMWCLNLIGLPGNWLIVATCLLWGWLGPTQFQFSWWLVAALIVLTLAGEAVEFAASVAGTRKHGGSNTGATCSLVGAVVGGLAGAIFGLPIPIPLIGSVIGSILFASAGAFAGAVIGEYWNGRPWKEALRIGKAAFIGRLLGTVGKFTLGAAMVGLAILAPFCF